MAEKEGLTMPILLDDDLAVVKSFGILNEKSPKVPHPTVVVIDPQGIVRFFHLDEDYRRRPPAADVLAAVKEVAGGE